MVMQVHRPDVTLKQQFRPHAAAIARTGGMALSVLAATMTGAEGAEFGLSRDRAIELERSTKVDFEFIESHSPYLSEFGVLNLDTNEKTPLIQQTKPYNDGATASGLAPFVSDLNSTDDYLGTPDQTVSQSETSFVFEAGNRYTLYLASSYEGQDAGTVYLMDELHGTQSQLALIDGEPEDLCSGHGNLLLWDDTGSLLAPELQQDRDFDDFVVNVRVWCNLEIAPVQTTAQMNVSGSAVSVSSGSFAAAIAPIAALASLVVSQAGGNSGRSSPSVPAVTLLPLPPTDPITPVPPVTDPPDTTEEAPEPSSLLGLAFAGSGWLWYRRRKQSQQSPSERL